MVRNLKPYLCILAMATCICGTVAQAQPAYRPTVGEMHPDFELPNIENGSRVKLSDYRGKKVLLIHFASW